MKKIFRLLSLLGVCGGVMACQSPQHVISHLLSPLRPTGELSKNELFATSLTIHQGVMAESDHELYLLMEPAALRSFSQIYEISLAPEALAHSQRKAKPLTWQGGEIQSFDVHSGELFYASTTDEIKERIHASESNSQQGAPTELYSRILSDDRLERLTEHPGFDGDVSLSPDGNFLIYVSQDFLQWKLVEMNRAKKKTKPVVVAQSKSVLRSPKYSAGQELAWIESEDSNSWIACRTGEKISSTLGEVFVGLQRAPKGGWIALAQNSLKSPSTVIYYVGARCSCLKKIDQMESLLHWVESMQSPQSALIYSEKRGDLYRVLQRPIPATAFACPVLETPATLKQ